MLPGDLIGGRYRLETKLASGGMGAVWTARHVELDTEVAVKFMHEELAATADAEARFRREAKAAARLRSPSIVQIFDFGVHEGAAYMAMERLSGEDLGALIEREGPRPVAFVRALLADVAEGLSLAHQAGIVHRDIKPSNLFLAREGGKVQVKLLDFGIAKETGTPLVSDARTSTGVVVGSPHYMSPEQARGQSVDPRSDLWSLAVAVYETLTGLPPFSGRTLGEIIAKICADPVPPPSDVLPALAPLDPFFATAFARDPAARYPTVEAFVTAFDSHARGIGTFVLPAAAPARSGLSAETRTTAVREVPAAPASRRRVGLLVALGGLGAAALAGVLLRPWEGAASAPPPPVVEPLLPAVAASAPVVSPETTAPLEPSVAPVVTASAAASAQVAATPGPKKAAPPASAKATATPPKAPTSGVDETFGIPLSR